MIAKLIIKNPISIKAILILASLLFTSTNSVIADNSPDSPNATEHAIQQQIQSANDCEALAKAAELTSVDAEDVFSKCIARRAIAIAMLVKYGVSESGQINEFDKIQAYAYLLESSNPLVQREAEKFSTAAGRPR